eukprot:2751806-Prymnesium_polylepis.1
MEWRNNKGRRRITSPLWCSPCVPDCAVWVQRATVFSVSDTMTTDPTNQPVSMMTMTNRDSAPPRPALS